MQHITYHAVEQFISRWEPEKTAAQALEELETLFRNSKIIGKTPLGDTIMASGYRPEIRLVVKERNVCVTVLPPGNINDATALYEEELEAIRETNAGRLALLEQEMAGHEEELKVIDEKRRALGEQKTQVINKIAVLKNKVHNLKTFLVTTEL